MCQKLQHAPIPPKPLERSQLSRYGASLLGIGNVHRQLKPWDFRTRQKLASLGLCLETLDGARRWSRPDLGTTPKNDETRKFRWNGPREKTCSLRARWPACLSTCTWHPRRHNCFTAMIGVDELVARGKKSKEEWKQVNNTWRIHSFSGVPWMKRCGQFRQTNAGLVREMSM